MFCLLGERKKKMYSLLYNVKQKALVMGQKKIFLSFFLGNKSILKNHGKFPQFKFYCTYTLVPCIAAVLLPIQGRADGVCLCCSFMGDKGIFTMMRYFPTHQRLWDKRKWRLRARFVCPHVVVNCHLRCLGYPAWPPAALAEGQRSCLKPFIISASLPRMFHIPQGISNTTRCLSRACTPGPGMHHPHSSLSIWVGGI